MNAYTETQMKIAAGQRNFGIHLIERLLAEHEAIRKENARLRELQIPFTDPSPARDLQSCLQTCGRERSPAHVCRQLCRQAGEMGYIAQ